MKIKPSSERHPPASKPSSDAVTSPVAAKYEGIAHYSLEQTPYTRGGKPCPTTLPLVLPTQTHTTYIPYYRQRWVWTGTTTLIRITIRNIKSFDSNYTNLVGPVLGQFQSRIVHRIIRIDWITILPILKILL